MNSGESRVRGRGWGRVEAHHIAIDDIISGDRGSSALGAASARASERSDAAEFTRAG